MEVPRRKEMEHKNANTKLDCERGGGKDLSTLWLKLHAETA